MAARAAAMAARSKQLDAGGKASAVLILPPLSTIMLEFVEELAVAEAVEEKADAKQPARKKQVAAERGCHRTSIEWEGVHGGTEKKSAVVA